MASLGSLAPAPAGADDRVDHPLISRAVLLGGGGVELTWVAAGTPEGFNVYRDDAYLTTIRGRTTYRDPDGRAGTKYEVVAFRDGRYSSKSPAVHVEGRVPTPRIKHVARPDGANYISVVWHRVTPGAEGVNIYRNDSYIGTVRGGNVVYNDFGGRVGDEYYLVALRGDDMSSKSTAVRAGNAGSVSASVDARFELGPDGLRTVITWNDLDSSVLGMWFYRLDSGRTVQPGQGTLVGYTTPGRQRFVDPNPVRGASYGVLVGLSSGTRLPIFTETVNYARPAVRLTPRCAGVECDFVVTDDTNPGQRFEDIEVIAVDPTGDDGGSAIFDPGGLGFLQGTQSSDLIRPGDEFQLEVPLTPETDPDNDGLSVLSDNDNDNDGIPTGEDLNDLDPSIGRLTITQPTPGDDEPDPPANIPGTTTPGGCNEGGCWPA